MKTLRVFWIGWLLHFKIMSRSLFAIGVGATWPIVNATANLPGWMQTVGQGLPVTHGLQAARRVADGAALGEVAHFVLVELAIDLAYATVGLALLRFLEEEARRRATLETA